MRPRLTAPVLLLLVAAAPAAGAEPWVPNGSKEGLSVASRVRPESKVREVRAVGEIAIDAERLFAVLGDIGRYPEIMPPTASARLLDRDGATALYHLVIDPPVVSRRDYCIRVTLTRIEDGALESRWQQTEEHCPAPERGIVRMRGADGRWRLRPLGPGRTEVEYVAFADPGGALPAWMVNRSVVSGLPGIFRALARAAADSRYAGCRAESFGCDGSRSAPADPL